MENVLYFSYTDNLDDQFSGVSRKIHSQVIAIENLGFNVYLAGFFNNLYKIQSEKEYIDLKGESLILKKKILFKFILEKIKKYQIKILYIRMFGASSSFISFLKEVKNLGLKIIMEIPTFPYDNEVIGIKGKILNFIDRVYRNKYKYVLDYIVTFSDDNYIYGVPCINISNAVDEETIEKDIVIKDDRVINFVSVSTLYYWHGVDRFLSSILNYLQNTDANHNIKFYIVGPDNAESLKIKKILNENPCLKDIVFYLGYKNSLELKQIYKDMHIGVGSLGRHRSNIYKINTLKNKEYCANGLPMIYSENDKDFDNQKFVYKSSADESLIDINDLCNWYIEHNWVDSEIISYIKNYTWHEQMKKVFLPIVGDNS